MWTIFPQHSACRVFPTILPSFIHPYFHHPIFSVTTHLNFQVLEFNPSQQRILFIKNPSLAPWHDMDHGDTPPKFNIAREKWWLGDYFPFGKVTFQGRAVQLQVAMPRESPAAWCLGRRTARGTRFGVVPLDLGPGTFHLLSLPHATDDGWRLRGKTPRLKEIPTITEWLGNHWVHFKGRKPSDNKI